jgi:hypothetical protein
LFVIGKKNDTYYIITSNKVSNDKKLVLEEQMRSITGATIDDLNEMYKRQLRDGKISNKGGAGLGLIDIARKAEGNLHYQFLSLDAEGYLFILKAEINAARE